MQQRVVGPIIPAERYLFDVVVLQGGGGGHFGMPTVV
jgi:hypothetical protein